MSIAFQRLLLCFTVVNAVTLLCLLAKGKAFMSAVNGATSSIAVNNLNPAQYSSPLPHFLSDNVCNLHKLSVNAFNILISASSARFSMGYRYRRFL